MQGALSLVANERKHNFCTDHVIFHSSGLRARRARVTFSLPCAHSLRNSTYYAWSIGGSETL